MPRSPASTATATHSAGIRRRLVTGNLIAVGVAVLLLGVPLAVVMRQWVIGQEVSQVRREAEQVLALIDSNLAVAGLAASVAVSAEALDARVTLLGPAGNVIRDSEAVPPGTVFDDGPVRAAMAGRPGGAILGDTLVVAINGTLSGRRVILRLAEPATQVSARIGSALAMIVALAAVALAVGVALASWRARQLAQPLEALAVSARRLGEGDFSQRTQRSDVAEIDHIAASLETTAGRLRAALERSASLSADASHQLRTPLTALRLNLEALAVELPSGSDALDAAEAEVDRLEATISELLALADAGAQAAEVDLRALALARLDAWRTIADAGGRAVHVTSAPVPRVRVRPGAVGQALQVLLDNALVHGQGDITVWLGPVRRGPRAWVRLCVGDQGPGPTEADLDGDGRGLPLAKALVEAEGGRLVFDADDGTRVCLLVPAVDDGGAQAVDDATS